jgi:Sulfotransferase domain
MTNVLSLGYPKSGNVWLNYLLRSAIEMATGRCRQAIDGNPVAKVMGQEQFGIRGQNKADSITIDPSGCVFKIAEVFQWPIDDLAEYASRTNLVLCHSPWHPACAEHYEVFSHRVLILRDPRDVAVSFSRFMFTPFNRLHTPTPYSGPDEFLKSRFPGIVQSWMEHMIGHLLKGHTDAPPHVVFYEQLVADTVAELTRIVRYLELELSDGEIQRIAMDHQLDRTRSRQPDHVFRGGWGNWLEFLDDGQVRAAGQIAGRAMEALGYPRSRLEAVAWDVERLQVPGRSVTHT